MQKFIYPVVKVLEIISVILTVLFALFTLSALMDRINNGPGFMFALKERLVIVTVSFLILSIFFLITDKQIKNGNKS